MNRYITIFQDNTIKRVLVEEQKYTEIIAFKSHENLNEGAYKHHVKSKVYKLITQNHEGFTGMCYNWEMIQSPYSDDSGLGNKYSQFETIGYAIQRMLKDRFTVKVDGVEIK